MGRLELCGLTKKYGETTALSDVSATIEDGEFAVIVGPSGCGKSTLLRMIAGLEPVDQGQILKNGTPIEKAAPRDRGVAMVFQNYALYPHMTVAENIGYSLKLQGMPRAGRAARIAEVAAMLSIADILERKPHAISGGQRQRVAIGRAIARAADIFLLDEPLSNLDTKLRASMRQELRRLHNRLGATTILVTHDQVEAMTLADRIIAMNAGRVEQSGSPGDIYHNPASLFVASFIGSPPVNLLAGILSNDGHAVQLPDGQTIALERQIGATPSAREIIVGVRPEHLSPGAGELSLTAAVTLVEDLGSHRLVHCDAAGQPLIMSTPDAAPARSGERLRLGWRRGNMLVFDAKTGKRLYIPGTYGQVAG